MRKTDEKPEGQDECSSYHRFIPYWESGWLKSVGADIYSADKIYGEQVRFENGEGF